MNTNRITKHIAEGSPQSKRTIYLASRSPRRREMLAEAGIEAKLIETGVDDGVLNPGEVSMEQWTIALAYFKAKAGAIRLEADGISGLVIGADTVVEWQGELIGKPRNREEAHKIITKLADDEHQVITGVAVVDLQSGDRSFLCDRSVVKVGRLHDEAISNYVASDRWVGKAGAYNLSERLSAGWPIEYEGDPTTIMGLPMKQLVPHLHKRWGVTVLSKSPV